MEGQGKAMTDEVRDRRTRPWFWVQKSVITDHGKVLGPYGITVYCYLAMRANEQGTCFPKQDTIAKETGMSRKSVSESLKQLKALNLIDSEQQFTASGFKSFVIYTLLEPMSPTVTTDVTLSYNECNPQLQPMSPTVTLGCNSGLQHERESEENKKHDNKNNTKEPLLSPKGENDKTKIEPKIASPLPKKSKPIETPIPTPWSCTPEMEHWATTALLGFDWRWETQTFEDYWLSNGKTKIDWVATWRNWMRRAYKNAKEQAPSQALVKKQGNGHYPIPNKAQHNQQTTFDSLTALGEIMKQKGDL